MFTTNGPAAWMLAFAGIFSDEETQYASLTEQFKALGLSNYLSMFVSASLLYYQAVTELEKATGTSRHEYTARFIDEANAILAKAGEE